MQRSRRAGAHVLLAQRWLFDRRTVPETRVQKWDLPELTHGKPQVMVSCPAPEPQTAPHSDFRLVPLRKKTCS